MIFLPFVFRFSWGLIALILSLTAPAWPLTWIMLNRNHPVTGLVFDLAGLMIILGVLLAVLRRAIRRVEKIPGLPAQDWLAVGLMCVLVINGFFLEGMRIAMTGSPPGAEYAFIGYALSRMMADSTGLTDAYSGLWHFHAGMAGLFLAYLPFSRMFHVIMAPVSLAVMALSEHKRKILRRKEDTPWR